MKLLLYPRIFNDKIVSVLRNIGDYRANILKSQQRIQKFSSNVDDDAPIDMENPYVKEKKLCFFCKYNIKPDYKNVRFLSQFQSSFSGRVYGKHITGLCTNQQKILEKEIAKAQHAGLMGFVTKHPKFRNDPHLFNMNKAIRSKIRL